MRVPYKCGSEHLAEMAGNETAQDSGKECWYTSASSTTSCASCSTTAARQATDWTAGGCAALGLIGIAAAITRG